MSEGVPLEGDALDYVEVSRVIVTRYLITYELDDNKTLWINTVTGAVDVVEPEMNQLLDRCRNGELLSSDLPAVNRLQERGYVFASRDEEQQTFEKAKALSEFDDEAKTLRFVLAPTYACNLRCHYCFEPLEIRLQKNVMSQDMVEAAFKTIRRVRAERLDMTKANLTLFGGEPLLPITKDAVTEILKQAYLHQLSTIIITNGTYIHEFTEILKPHQPGTMIQVTMDGTPEIHDTRRINAAGRGTFDQIFRNVTWLLENNFQTLVRVNVDRNNVETLADFMDMIERAGWNKLEHFRCQFAPVTDHSCSKFDTDLQTAFQLFRGLLQRIPNLGERMTEMKVSFTPDMFRTVLPFARVLYPTIVTQDYAPVSDYCEANHLRFYVMGPDGLIYPCTEGLGRDGAIGRFWPNYEIDEELASLWNNRTVFTMPACSECELALICGGGCAWTATMKFGSPHIGYCQAKGYLRHSLGLIKEELIQLVDSAESKGV